MAKKKVISKKKPVSKEAPIEIKKEESPDDIDDEFLLEVAVVQFADGAVRDIEYGFPGDFKKGNVSERLYDLFDVDDKFIEQFHATIFEKIELAGEIMNLV